MTMFLQQLHEEELGASTAEYGVVVLAAVGFAGVLTLVLSSDGVRNMLTSLIQRALNV